MLQNQVTEPRIQFPCKDNEFDASLFQRCLKSNKIKVTPSHMIRTQHELCRSIKSKRNKENSIALSYCGKHCRVDANAGTGAQITAHTNGNVSLKGSLVRCGSPNCYWCAKRKAAKKVEEIQRVLDAAKKKGYRCFFVTYTHKKHLSVEKNYKATYAGTKKVSKYITNHNGKWQKKGGRGVEWMFVTEATFSAEVERIEDGWGVGIHIHPHWLVLIPEEYTEEHVNRIRTKMRDNWDKGITSEGSWANYENNEGGANWIEANLNAATIAGFSRYISKAIHYENDTKQRLSMEMSLASTKTGGKGLNIVQLLQKIILTGSAQHKKVYQDWISYTAGRHNWRNSKGWRALEDAGRQMAKEREEAEKMAILALISSKTDLIERLELSKNYLLWGTAMKPPQKNDELGTLDVPSAIYNAITRIGEHYTLITLVRDRWCFDKYVDVYDELDTFCEKHRQWKDNKRRISDPVFIELCSIMARVKDKVDG